MNAITKYVAGVQARAAGKAAAVANAYNPELFIQRSMPRPVVWSPETLHAQIQEDMMTEVETEVEVRITSLETNLAASGSTLGPKALLVVLLGAEFLGAIGLIHELGIEGFAALPLGAGLAAALLYLVGEVHQ